MRLHRYVAGLFGYELVKSRKLNDTLEQHLSNVIAECGINLVVDVGANIGRYGRSLRRHGYAGRIASFEPLPGAYEQLTLLSGVDPKWWSYNFALGASDRGIEMKSLVDVWPDVTHCLTEPKALLKLDTQGHDLMVLAGGKDIMSDVQAIQVEISLRPVYEGAPHYLDALVEFETAGFEITGMYPVSRDKKSLTIIEYDCVMTRHQGK